MDELLESIDVMSFELARLRALVCERIESLGRLGERAQLAEDPLPRERPESQPECGQALQ